MDCTAGIVHLSVNLIPDCGPFSFEVVTQSASAPFSSTSVATASASMTGAVVQCRDGLGTAAIQLGRNITLCIIGEHMCYFRHAWVSISHAL